MFIPYFCQKLWYGFGGLPVEEIGGVARLPWPKALVLTNNLMYILNIPSITEVFHKKFPKVKVELNYGISFKEYLEFLHENIIELNCNNPSSPDWLTNSNPEEAYRNRSESSNSLNNMVSLEQQQVHQLSRPRGNTFDGKQFTNNNSITNSNDDFSQKIKAFDDYCWTLYRTKFLPNLTLSSKLHDIYEKWWNLFIMYSLYDIEDNIDHYRCHKKRIPIKMDEIEGKYWISCIREQLGERRGGMYDDELGCIKEDIVEIDFKRFYEMLEEFVNTKCRGMVDEVIEEAMNAVYEEAVEGLVMKGCIKIDGKQQRYCELKNQELYIYNNKTGPINLRSKIYLDSKTKITCSASKIQIKNVASPVIILEAEREQLNKWRTGILDIIEYSGTEVNASVRAADKRNYMRKLKRDQFKKKRMSMEYKIEEERKVRTRTAAALEQRLVEADEEIRMFQERMLQEQQEKENLLKETEEIKKEKEMKINHILQEQQLLYQKQLERLQSIETEKDSLNQQLEATKEEKIIEENRRAELEEKHNQAQIQLKEAEKEIQALHLLGDQLQKALEEEKQAKEDEAVVRNATLALLNEEMDAKKKLEELLEQQSGLINMEIQKRNEFAEALENEKRRIQKIAEEKDKLTLKLEESEERSKNRGLEVRRLDNKVSKLADTIFGSRDPISIVSHRGHGFIAELKVNQKFKNKSNLTKLTEDSASSRNESEQES